MAETFASLASPFPCIHSIGRSVPSSDIHSGIPFHFNHILWLASLRTSRDLEGAWVIVVREYLRKMPRHAHVAGFRRWGIRLGNAFLLKCRTSKTL